MPRFRLFPKLNGQIDKDGVRELYLRSPYYDWTEFCAAHKFNPALRSEFPVRSWQAEWIQRKSVEQAQMLAPKALELRSKIARGRVDVIEAQMQTNALLRGILNQNLDLIGKNQSGAMTQLVSAELAVLAKANQLIQQAEFQTLLMSAKTATINGSPDAPLMDESREDAEDQIPEYEIHTIGHEGVPAKELAKELAAYFDQFDGKPAEHNVLQVTEAANPTSPSEDHG